MGSAVGYTKFYPLRHVAHHSLNFYMGGDGMKFVQNLASITRSHSPLSRYRFEKEKNIFRKTLYTPVIELYPCHTKSLVQFGPFP